MDLMENVETAIRTCNVQPKCVIGWRDGVSDTSFDELVPGELEGIRAGLGAALSGDDPGEKRKSREVPIAYVICQKSVANKFFCIKDGAAANGAPSGTLVSDLRGLAPAPSGGIGGAPQQGSDQTRFLETFFINGRAPMFSTAKPVRFVVVERDEALHDVSLEDLTWAQCHDYFNWTGPVRLPAVTQMAHKLAELAGTFGDCGSQIDQRSLANKAYFL
jgi:hypothetical protein